MSLYCTANSRKALGAAVVSGMAMNAFIGTLFVPQFLGPDADSERENNGQVSPQEILEFRFLRILYKKAVSNHRHGFSQLTNYLSEGKR